MRRQLKNSPLFLCLLVILQQCGVTKTEKCPGISEEEQKSKKQIVDITLDPKSSLWTSPGTYQTVVLQLHLPFNDIKNATQTEVRPIQLSYNEKFPSKGHHATFVTSLRPLTAHLSSALPLKVT
eukprot:06624.XXX_13359_12383_1 [CDS] Oithona nana genome sequencing.